MKLFQIEEPDGTPADPDAPGVAVGIDIGGTLAEVALAVGGNAVVLHDREDFPLELAVPPSDAPADDWRDLFEGSRIRAERALAQPVTHAVLALPAPASSGFADKLKGSAEAAGLAVLAVIAPQTPSSESRAALAAIRAEELAPRPESPLPGPTLPGTH